MYGLKMRILHNSKATNLDARTCLSDSMAVVISGLSRSFSTGNRHGSQGQRKEIPHIYQYLNHQTVLYGGIRYMDDEVSLFCVCDRMGGRP